ncbi:S8 family serine peptidase [Kitasatospora sp. CB02891]|uniref:S8 family serine peptidase n=1 Tax=Kitasatospora sp. CB02891 TaxID=2020329 RepID=UPI001E5FD659|nr:S8 family serine peptidase [Kitasatospora sp. CB02891]
MLGATTLTAGFLLTGLPAASADQVRDGQWANQYFNLSKVWSITRGEGVTVAVIDSGVNPNHPDLAGHVLPGYDPSGGGNEVGTANPHGTGVASLIAGQGHGSGDGVVGLAPGVKILPIYKLGPGGAGGIGEGIKWAVDHDAKVINISQGGPDLSAREKDAIAYAYQHDVLIVAAAGNVGAGVDYPAKAPGVLAVGAVAKDLKIWPKSNFGPEVLLSAPGVRIVSAGDCGTSQYCMDDGTSFATPYVAAAAALVRAKFPKLTAGQVAERLVKSAARPDGVSKLPDQHYGYGIVSPYEALTMNIPAGSAQGPLALPEGVDDGGSSPAASQGATTGGGSSTDPGSGLGDPGAAPELKQSSTSTMPLILGAIGGAVVLLIVIIAIVVANSRRRNRSQSVPGQPGGPVPYGAPQGWPPAQQPPYGQQPGAPQYGQQPPPGYPQQPPTGYQNPYQGQ